MPISFPGRQARPRGRRNAIGDMEMNPVRAGTTTTLKRIGTRVLAVTAAVVLLALSLGVAAASADDGRDHRNAENTFTKWVTGPGVAPVLANMAGVVGGDVGAGAFAGEVLSKVVVGTTATIDARYHFNGSRHSFSASVHVVQTGIVDGSKAVIIGWVTDGWLKGNRVTGEYTQVTCEKAPGVFGTCFKGTLDIRRGSKHDGDHRNAENTFTKWVTGPGVAPVLANMAGVVGGDVGAGAFAGEVLSKVVVGTTATIDARYHFNGSRHSFSASVHVVQTGIVDGSKAVIIGWVTDGWLKGNRVTGEYTQVTCEKAPGVFGTCFKGTLDIRRGSKHGD